MHPGKYFLLQDAISGDLEGIPAITSHSRLVAKSFTKGLDKGCNAKGKTVETREEKKAREQKVRGCIVHQFDLDGNFIATYPSLRDAARKLGIHPKAVMCAVQGNYRQANGYQFRYDGSSIPILKGIKTPRENIRKWNVASKGKPVCLLNEVGEEIMEFPSVNQAEKHFGIRDIAKYIKNNKPIAGHYWKYKKI